MLNTHKLPHLRSNQSKVTLDADQRTDTGTLLFLLSTTPEDAREMLDGENLNITNTSVRHYYLERIYAEKVASRTVYRTLSSKLPERFKTYPNTFITPISSRGSVRAGASRFVDLSEYMNIFFTEISENTYNYSTACVEFINMLQRTMVKAEYNIFPNKTALINVDDWEQFSAKMFGHPDSLNNPVSFIYYLIYKYHERFKELGDIDFIIFSKKSGIKVRVNPKEVKGGDALKFRTEMTRVSPLAGRLVSDNFDKQVREEEVRTDIASAFSSHYNFTGAETKTEKLITQTVKSAVNDKDMKSDESVTDNKENLADEIDNDKELAKKVSDVIKMEKVGKSKASSARDKALREKQASLAVGDKNLTSILESKDSYEIPSTDISSKLSTTNKNMYKVQYSHFEKAYNEQLAQKDLFSMVTALNNARVPVFIRSIKVEDKSDELNYVDRYSIQLEDDNRVRHSLTFDMPKFIDDKFMYLHGNRKEIVKQQFMLPIVKIDEDVVQIVSNYNKIFVRRYGEKVSPKLEKFRKFVDRTDDKVIKVKHGDPTSNNVNYKTTIEFDSLARQYEKVETSSEVYYLDLNAGKKIAEAGKFKFETTNDKEETQLFIGVNKKTKKPIYLNTDTGSVNNEQMLDIVDTILLSLDDADISGFDSIGVGKRYMYSRATMMNKAIPTALILSYYLGLSGLLRKLGISHSFSDKRPQTSRNDVVIQFEDGYLVYDNSKIETGLIMNGFSSIPTRGFKYEEMDGRDAYIDIFQSLYNQRKFATAFDNFKDFMIDPITKEVLEDLDLPTEFEDIIIYASNLLADNQYTPETDLSLYRIRSNEILSHYLYKAITQAYTTYVNTMNNPNPIKISIPRDSVTKAVLTAQTIEDYSVLNPIVEVEKGRSVSAKGPSGANVTRAYTMAKRSYSPSMTGVMAMTSSPDSNVGMVRALSTEPTIKSARGYIETNEDRLEDLKDVNIFSPGELLSPLGASRDDTIRTSMAIKQSKHIIPVQNSSPVLISNGMEQALPFNTGNDFSIVSKEDGKVVEVNEGAGLVVIEYKKPASDGSRHLAFHTGERVVKNGAGGFYLANQLVHELKLGQTVKKNDVVAHDKNFYTTDNDGVRFNIGSLEKIAIFSNAATLEDSAFVTNKLARDIATKITMPKSVTLGKNASVDHIVKIGDNIKVGDELIRFESSYNDESINKFLANVRSDLNEEIKSLGKKPITSHYTGRVVDIKVYSTVDIDELSPSLQKIVKDSYKRTNEKKNILNKYDKSDTVYKMGIYQDEPTSKIVTPDGKVKGEIVGEGVLIQIFIEYLDVAKIGDKIAFFTALKGIIGEVVDEGYEPYTLNEPEEEISAFVAPAAILARMTPSIILTLFGNKVLVKLKKELQKIYEE